MVVMLVDKNVDDLCNEIQYVDVEGGGGLGNWEMPSATHVPETANTVGSGVRETRGRGDLRDKVIYGCAVGVG